MPISRRRDVEEGGNAKRIREEERYVGAVRVHDEPPPPAPYGAIKAVEGSANCFWGCCEGNRKRGDDETHVSGGNGREKDDSGSVGNGVFKAVNKACNRRTRRRKGRRRKVRMGITQMKWVIGKIEGIIKKYPVGGPEPLRDYTRAVERFTTKTFMCWKCIIVAMEDQMDKDEAKWNCAKRAEMYGNLGMEEHYKFFANAPDDDAGEKNWKLQRKELAFLLTDSDNDVMVTDLAYDGNGRAKVAGYSVDETFLKMRMRGG